MRIRRLKIDRFRGIQALTFCPGPRTVILGPNNSCKSTVLEALDLLLHSGLGRPRPVPSEVDYFGRDSTSGFEIEAVLGGLEATFISQVPDHLEGWREGSREVVPEPDGDGVEPIVRVRARGTHDFDLLHEFAKPESNGARFSPSLRVQVGWVFDGRARDPSRQLAFYQGGVLDRLFAGADLDPAIESLRAALRAGAAAVNSEVAIDQVMVEIGNDLHRIGLLDEAEAPQFELGAVSRRELLQSLRLGLPAAGIQVPLARHGRGAQRLLLVTLLLRLAGASDVPTIGGFEEPEEALEPLRQSQVARMLADLADRGGQVFVVTHSPEIARAFCIDDFFLLRERTAGAEALLLRDCVPAPIRQTYERTLDQSTVRGLFARIAVLVEGPGDRAVFETFWRELANLGTVRTPERMGLDIVNCEGAPLVPPMASLLKAAGKRIVVWIDRDRVDVLDRLKREQKYDALILHEEVEGRRDLEGAIAHGAPLSSLVSALDKLATSRGYTWENQRADLISRSEHLGAAKREAIMSSVSLEEIVSTLDEPEARTLLALALSSKNVAPFEMKGASQGRLVAETIVQASGVPTNFLRALQTLDAWLLSTGEQRIEVAMSL